MKRLVSRNWLIPGGCRDIRAQRKWLPDEIKSDWQASVRALTATFFSARLEILAGSGRQRQNIKPADAPPSAISHKPQCHDRLPHLGGKEEGQLANHPLTMLSSGLRVEVLVVQPPDRVELPFPEVGWLSQLP